MEITFNEEITEWGKIGFLLLLICFPFMMIIGMYASPIFGISVGILISSTFNINMQDEKVIDDV